MLRTKEQDPKYENLTKIETNARSLHFSPKSFIHYFGSFCYCFPSLRLKNITVKSLGRSARRLPKVRNQHMMTWFCTQTIRTSFLVILLLFSINTVKKMLVTEIQYLLHKNLSKMKTKERWLRFSPKSFAHNFGHFVVVSH